MPSNLIALYLANTHINSIPDLPSNITILNASNSKITILPTLPKSLINIDISNCIFSQRNADTIITNLVTNNVNNGTLFIIDQYRNQGDTMVRQLNTTGTIWLKLKNPPFNWDVN